MSLCVVVAACGGSKHDGGAKNGGGSTSTRAQYVWPLTGVVTTDVRASTRPALTVKVENIAQSRPQIGLDVADVVYEEVVECSITRLAAVFQSKIPPTVGPIRSVRRTDAELVQPLRGVFAYSGGAAYAIASIQTAPVVRLDESRAGAAMFRMAGRGGAPHNLFGRGLALYQKARGAQGPPSPLFQYDASVPAGGSPATHSSIGFQARNSVQWDWDAAARGWQRTWNGTPDPVHARNVVIMQVGYTVGQGACNSVGAQAELDSAGPLTLLRDGRVWHGTWKYDPATKTQQLADSAGNPLPLAPGNTWVELPKPTYTVAVR